MLKRTQLLRKYICAPTDTFKIARMSTFIIPDTEVSAKLADNLTQEQLLEFPAFKVPLPCMAAASHILSPLTATFTDRETELVQNPPVKSLSSDNQL